MNYYERHLGDYAKDTKWLTTYQHGVYTLLLDWYYTNERAIPLELVFRIVNARSGPERKATQEVVETFFDLANEPGFAHNKRADFVISKYKVKQHDNSLKAKKRWDAASMPVAMPRQCRDDASQKPVTSNQEKAKKEANASLSAGADNVPACPHSEILALYHEALPANPKIKVWDGSRADALRTRWREDSKRQSLDYWKRFFAHVAASEFLTGKVTGQGGRPFLPGLEWMVKPANFAKIIEGRYHDKGAQS